MLLAALVAATCAGSNQSRGRSGHDSSSCRSPRTVRARRRSVCRAHAATLRNSASAARWMISCSAGLIRANRYLVLGSFTRRGTVRLH